MLATGSQMLCHVQIMTLWGMDGVTATVVECGEKPSVRL